VTRSGRALTSASATTSTSVGSSADGLVRPNVVEGELVDDRCVECRGHQTAHLDVDRIGGRHEGFMRPSRIRKPLVDPQPRRLRGPIDEDRLDGDVLFCGGVRGGWVGCRRPCEVEDLVLVAGSDRECEEHDDVAHGCGPVRR
jgi:hypothetical protein